MTKSAVPQLRATGEFLLFQTGAAQTRMQVRLIDGALWLTQRQMATLYQKDILAVNEHLENVYADGELNPNTTIRKFRIVAREGARDRVDLSTKNRVIRSRVPKLRSPFATGRATSR